MSVINITLSIDHGDNRLFPVVQDGIELTWERKGQAGKLTFSVVKDKALQLQEGNPVHLRVNDTDVFFGYVFTKTRDKGDTIQVVAYDQLRYLLKNKDTIGYQNKKASELIAMIAEDYHLDCGALADTGYVIETGTEENQSLMDIIQNALDITLRQSKKLFVLYDHYGRLALENVERMLLNIVVDEQSGENFEYESSIDHDTYNKVKLIYENEETGKRDVFTQSDVSNIEQWGMLQYFESIKNPAGADEKAKVLLQMYNQKTRRLSLKNVLGDVRVRGGTSLVVALDLGDIKVQNYMVVNSVKHVFRQNEHLMDLALLGGEFIA